MWYRKRNEGRLLVCRMAKDIFAVMMTHSEVWCYWAWFVWFFLNQPIARTVIFNFNFVSFNSSEKLEKFTSKLWNTTEKLFNHRIKEGVDHKSHCGLCVDGNLVALCNFCFKKNYMRSVHVEIYENANICCQLLNRLYKKNIVQTFPSVKHNITERDNAPKQHAYN